MIRGKYDSLWKYDWNLKTNRPLRSKRRGHFMTAMDYACSIKGGIRAIESARRQPWATWTAL